MPRWRLFLTGFFYFIRSQIPKPLYDTRVQRFAALYFLMLKLNGYA